MAKPNAKVQLLALTVRASYDQIRALDFLATVQSAVQDERKKDKDHFLRCLCGDLFSATHHPDSCSQCLIKPADLNSKFDR